MDPATIFMLLVISVDFFGLCNSSLHTAKQERVRGMALLKALTKGLRYSNVRQGDTPRRPLKVIQPERYTKLSPFE